MARLATVEVAKGGVLGGGESNRGTCRNSYCGFFSSKAKILILFMNFHYSSKWRIEGNEGGVKAWESLLRCYQNYVVRRRGGGWREIGRPWELPRL